MALVTGRTSDGVEFDVIPVGARVRHKKHLELVGKIYSHEFHGVGVYSALPYTVDWDDAQLARDLLGLFPIWPRLEDIEEVARM